MMGFDPSLNQLEESFLFFIILKLQYIKIFENHAYSQGN